MLELLVVVVVVELLVVVVPPLVVAIGGVVLTTPPGWTVTPVEAVTRVAAVVAAFESWVARADGSAVPAVAKLD